MPDFSTLELCQAAHEVAKAARDREALDKALEAWERFSIKEVQAATTAEAIIEALRRCPDPGGREKSQAAELAALKWKEFEEPLIERTKTLEEAKILRQMAPNNSSASRYALDLWQDLSQIEAITAIDLGAAKRAFDRAPYGYYRSSKAYILAKNKWDEFAMAEAKAAKNHEEAKLAFERARPKSPARNFLIEKFFSPPKA